MQLTNWNNEPTIDSLKQDLNNSNTYHSGQVELFLSLYVNRQNGDMHLYLNLSYPHLTYSKLILYPMRMGILLDRMS